MSLPKVLENLKVAVKTAQRLCADILVSENAPARLKIPPFIFGEVVEVLTCYAKEGVRAILLAKDGCECLAVCIGEAADEVCAARIESVLRDVSRATALCANLVKWGMWGAWGQVGQVGNERGYSDKNGNAGNAQGDD